MRKFIDIVEGKTLNEGVDFEPRVKRIEDGRTIIDYPPNSTEQREEDCEYCEGTAQDYYYEDGPDGEKIKKFDPEHPCRACSDNWGNPGNGRVKKWHYSFPSMRIPYMFEELLCHMLGREHDHSGFIPHDQLPDLKRRLIGIINGGSIAQFTRPETDVGGEIRVDRSGDIPRIGRGMRMIGGGVNDEQARAGAKRMLEIVDWAQKNGTGVGWA